MPFTDAVDGFRLAYDDHPGDAGTVVLLHGWPGDRHDWREVVPLLKGRCRIVVPDLRGSASPSRVPTRRRRRSAATVRPAASPPSSSSSEPGRRF
jgi:pimeloyl-ACP methyl ester carboxylesterase